MGAAAKAMTKGAIADALATKAELKKSVVTKLLGSLAEVGAAEVKKSGVFTIPGLARIKTRRKPATKASKKMMFGKEVVVTKACQDCRQGLPNSCAQGRYLILDFARQVSRVIAWEVPPRGSPCPACWPGEGAATTAIVYDPQQNLGPACTQKEKK